MHEIAETTSCTFTINIFKIPQLIIAIITAADTLFHDNTIIGREFWSTTNKCTSNCVKKTSPYVILMTASFFKVGDRRQLCSDGSPSKPAVVQLINSFLCILFSMELDKLSTIKASLFPARTANPPLYYYCATTYNPVTKITQGTCTY